MTLAARRVGFGRGVGLFGLAAAAVRRVGRLAAEGFTRAGLDAAGLDAAGLDEAGLDATGFFVWAAGFFVRIMVFFARLAAGFFARTAAGFFARTIVRRVRAPGFRGLVAITSASPMTCFSMNSLNYASSILDHASAYLARIDTKMPPVPPRAC